MTEHCASLIRGLLQHNIEQRLGCGQRAMLDLLEHAWFTEINFWSLYRQHYLAPFLPVRKHFLQVKTSDEVHLKFSAKNQYENELMTFDIMWEIMGGQMFVRVVLR